MSQVPSFDGISTLCRVIWHHVALTTSGGAARICKQSSIYIWDTKSRMLLPDMTLSSASSLYFAAPPVSTTQRYRPASASEALLTTSAPLGSWNTLWSSTRGSLLSSQREKATRSWFMSHRNTWLSPCLTRPASGWLENLGIPKETNTWERLRGKNDH